MNQKYYVILCTVPDEATAAAISRALVTEKLAACCNVIPGLRSIYRWKGEICDDREYLLMIKSHADVYGRLEQRIQSLHPYEIPEILALPVNEGFLKYLTWVDENVE